jgi:DNA (cytosine-5)-methyltransferase 1
MLSPQFLLPIHHELVIDLFAGGGGASTGIEQAIGRSVDIAINHDPEAVALHQANHPQTLHFVSDVFEVDPLAVVDGRPVGMLWASPDCKHFSKAKGGKPVSKKIRGLAWVVIKWAKLVRPRVIFLENVEEFQTWGPLDANNMPCKERKGRTFKRWKSSLENLGYTVDFREDRASDMGTPTIRKRLFLVARCDGLPIVFPSATHGAPDTLPVKQKKLKPFRTAAECIQWDIPAPSIFERTRPLAEATKRRIAKGIMRYVVNAANPFIVPLTHQGGDRTEDITKPFNTVTGANRGEKALIVPTLVQTGYGEREGQAPRALDLHKPLGTVVAGQKHALVTAFLNEHANASSQRVMPIDEPLRTQMAEVKGGHFGLVAASLVKHYTGVVGSDMEDPLGTVTSVDHHSLLTAHLTKFRSGSTGSAMDEPIHTVTAGGTPARASTGNVMGMVTAVLAGVGGRAGQSRPRGLDEPTATATSKADAALITANLVHMGHGEEANGAKHWSHGVRDITDPLNTVTASGMPAALVTSVLVNTANSKTTGRGPNAWDAETPLRTVTSSGGQALVTSNLIKLRGTSKEGQPVDEPLHTISAQGTHHAEVRAFLVKYYGTDQDPQLGDPLHTVTTKDRFGLVTVKGQQYQIVDIGLRMLTPRELYRAQGFPESYQIERGGDGRVLTKTAQVRMCGNSVCPPMARAYVAANYQESQRIQEAA